MSTGICKIILYEKIATGLHHGLDTVPDCFQILAIVALGRMAITPYSWPSAKEVLWGALFISLLQKSCNFSSPEDYCLWTSNLDMQHQHGHST
jgi:hypothetical protein